MRSKLFVPGSRPELFDKALQSEADALSFDLEDAVVEEKKSEARQYVKVFLDKEKEHSKTIIVRTNHVSSAHFQEDVKGIISNGLDILNIPKVESVQEVLKAVQTLEKMEKEFSIAKQIPILVNIESPKGLRLASELAQSHPRVMGLQIGYGDLFAPLSIDRTNQAAIDHVMFSIRMAAGEANILAIDGAYTNVANIDGFKDEAAKAKMYGFLGKSCIHPVQVAHANSIFRPSDADIEYSLKVLAALRQADKQGVGAFTVDGKMVDAPLFEQAKKIVNQARQLGLLDIK